MNNRGIKGAATSTVHRINKGILHITIAEIDQMLYHAAGFSVSKRSRLKLDHLNRSNAEGFRVSSSFSVSVLY